MIEKRSEISTPFTEILLTIKLELKRVYKSSFILKFVNIASVVSIAISVELV